MIHFLYLSILLSTVHTYGAIILIDPGHGGSDFGAQSSFTYKTKKNTFEKKYFNEKDLTLQFSKRLYKELIKNHSVFLTRTYDKTISLEERAKMAEKINGDIFISIHVNSGLAKNFRGFETYYLDNHNDQAVKKVEDIENQKFQDQDLMVNKILIDLIIERTVDRSKKLARSIHSNISNSVKKKFKYSDRGYKPGLFYVLALSKIPAVLSEVGFISNPWEAKKMLDPHFQEMYVQAVAKGIDNYIKN